MISSLIFKTEILLPPLRLPSHLGEMHKLRTVILPLIVKVNLHLEPPLCGPLHIVIVKNHIGRNE